MNNQIINYLKKINNPLFSVLGYTNTTENKNYEESSYIFNIVSDEKKDDKKIRIKFKSLSDDIKKNNYFDELYNYLSNNFYDYCDVKYITLTIITTLLLTVKILYTNLLYR